MQKVIKIMGVLKRLVKNFINKINSDLFFCIDIGANVGKYTNLLLTETKSKIISFEPLPLAFKDLKNRTK